jgi:hypothetical protein
LVALGPHLHPRRQRDGQGAPKRHRRRPHPWTFASDRAWRRTNRASGWAFALTGLAALALGLLLAAPPFWLPLALVALVLLETLALARLSYLEWRADPERRPLGSRPT